MTAGAEYPDETVDWRLGGESEQFPAALGPASGSGVRCMLGVILPASPQCWDCIKYTVVEALEDDSSLEGLSLVVDVACMGRCPI